MAFSLIAETKEKIDRLVPRFPVKRSAVLPLLHMVQKDKGYISKEAMEWVAKKLDLQPINVYEVVTFYPMLREKPIGCRHVKVCRTLPCALNGAYDVKQKLEEALCGTKDDPTPDAGDYTIEFVECIACCGTAPVVQVDEVLHESVGPEKISAFAEEIRKETPRIKKQREERAMAT